MIETFSKSSELVYDCNVCNQNGPHIESQLLLYQEM